MMEVQLILYAVFLYTILTKVAHQPVCLYFQLAAICMEMPELFNATPELPGVREEVGT